MQTRFEQLVESVSKQEKTQEEITQELGEIQSEVREIAKARVSTLTDPIELD